MLERDIQTHEKSNLLPNSSAGELRSYSACGPLTYFCTRGCSDLKHSSYSNTRRNSQSFSSTLLPLEVVVKRSPKPNMERRCHVPRCPACIFFFLSKQPGSQGRAQLFQWQLLSWCHTMAMTLVTTAVIPSSLSGQMLNKTAQPSPTSPGHSLLLPWSCSSVPSLFSLPTPSFHLICSWPHIKIELGNVADS